MIKTPSAEEQLAHIEEFIAKVKGRKLSEKQRAALIAHLHAYHRPHIEKVWEYMAGYVANPPRAREALERAYGVRR